MAAFMSVKEVREMVSRDEEMVIHAEELTNDEVNLTEEIKECLKMVGNSNIDFDFFVDAGVSHMKGAGMLVGRLLLNPKRYHSNIDREMRAIVTILQP